jgi:putative ABC transport system permease protein
MYFAVRTTEAFATFGPALTAAVAEVDASTPVAELRPLSRTLSDQLQELRLAALIVGTFALVAAVLAATGVYGVISLAVADRAREIALRIVVGAGAGQIASMVLRNVLRLVGIGLALGLLVAAVSSRVLAWALYGIAPTDPSTYAIVAALFVIVAVVSCLLPALKAARVDPTVALKAE